jgi:hypothetical protein
MTNTNESRYPLLDAVLSTKNLSFQSTYSHPDVAEIFNVTSRTIQEWIASGKLVSRELPGRGRFLSVDLEEFLHKSKRSQ